MKIENFARMETMNTMHVEVVEGMDVLKITNGTGSEIRVRVVDGMMQVITTNPLIFEPEMFEYQLFFVEGGELKDSPNNGFPMVFLNEFFSQKEIKRETTG